jgi:beta-lactam-binding protein with PASTA domain
LKRFIRTYITGRSLWVNILVGLILMLLIGVLFALSLNWITQHGVARTVPSVTGKKIDDVRSMLKAKGFEVVVQDSVYYDSLAPMVIIKQVPEADAVVKVNRTVYVTVNRLIPPDIDMPNLVGYSLRNAEMVMKNLGLKLGDTTFKPDFARNSVLEQMYNGNRIAPGTKIKIGSRIALVLGTGLGNMDMPVPKLIGLTFTEAKIVLEQQGISLGATIPDPTVRDTANAFVYWQSPEPKDDQGRQFRIRPGQMIDIRLSLEPPPNPDSLKVRLPQEPDQQEQD